MRLTPNLLALLYLIAPAALADDYSSSWSLALGCPSHDATGSSGGLTMGSGGFSASGTCGRVTNGYAKFTITGSSGGTLNSSTLYPLQMGSVGVIPPVRTTDATPVFSVASSCPTSTANVNWMFVQSAAARTGEHFWGRSTMAPSSTTMTQHFNIGGTELFNGTYSVPVGSCSGGVYDVTGSSDFQAKLYSASDWSGFYKSSPGNVSFVLPIWSIDQTLLGGSKTYSGIYFNAQDSTSTTYVRVTSNAGGTTFTVKPFSDPENNTLLASGAAYTETITITAINSPLVGMMKGTISRVNNGGTPVGTTEAIGCLANDAGQGGLIVSCAGKNPLDNTKNYSVTFNYKFPAATLDPAFNSTGSVRATTAFNTVGYAVALQADGKIVVAGASNFSGYHNFLVARVLANGTLDTTFNSTGFANATFGLGHDYARAVAIQSDGKIVLAGMANTGSTLEFGVMRFTTAGALDTTFNSTGKMRFSVGSGNAHAYDVAIQADGKIVVGGHDYTGNDFALARVTSTGALDTTFSGDGKLTLDFSGAGDLGKKVAIQADGKILIAGSATVSGNYDFAVARYNSDGTLDTTFNSTGKVTTAIGTSTDNGEAITIQSDGKIILGGSALYSSNYFALARYNSDGSLDTTFNSTGKVTTAINVYDDIVNSVAIQGDGKIVAMGMSSPGQPSIYLPENYHDFAVVRYNTNGSVDTSLAGGSTTRDLDNGDTYCTGGVIQSDGKYLLVGFTSDQGPSYGIDLMRIIP